MDNRFMLNFGRMIFEDSLPDDLTDDEYNIWYEHSFVPDGVGCRVGPAVVRVAAEAPPEPVSGSPGAPSSIDVQLALPRDS